MRVTIIFLATAVVIIGLTLTRASLEPSPPQPDPSAPVVRPAPAAAFDRSAVGTLLGVDAAAGQFAVDTGGRRLQFHLEDGATIRQGLRTLKLAELPRHSGERVKVRYLERGPERRADWIVLAVPARGASRKRD